MINKKSIFYKLNINQKEKIRKIIIKNNIDTIIHMAAFIRVDESIKYPKKYDTNNTIGTKLLIEAAKKTSVKKVYIFFFVLSLRKSKQSQVIRER